jgi:hypothetical protein
MLAAMVLKRPHRLRRPQALGGADLLSMTRAARIAGKDMA